MVAPGVTGVERMCQEACIKREGEMAETPEPALQNDSELRA